MFSNVTEKFIYCIVGLCSSPKYAEGDEKAWHDKKLLQLIAHAGEKLKGWPHTFIEQFINISCF